MPPQTARPLLRRTTSDSDSTASSIHEDEPILNTAYNPTEVLEWGWLIFKKFLQISALLLVGAEVIKMFIGLPPTHIDTSGIVRRARDAKEAMPDIRDLGMEKEVWVSKMKDLQAMMLGTAAWMEKLSELQAGWAPEKTRQKTVPTEIVEVFKEVYVYPMTHQSDDIAPSTWRTDGGQWKPQQRGSAHASCTETVTITEPPTMRSLAPSEVAYDDVSEPVLSGTFDGFEHILDTASYISDLSIRTKDFDSVLKKLQVMVLDSYVENGQAIVSYLDDFRQHVRETRRAIEAYQLAASFSYDFVHGHTQSTLSPLQEQNIQRTLPTLLESHASTILSHYSSATKNLDSIARLIKHGSRRLDEVKTAYLNEMFGWDGEGKGSVLLGLWRLLGGGELVGGGQRLERLEQWWWEIERRVQGDRRVLRRMEALSVGTEREKNM